MIAYRKKLHNSQNCICTSVLRDTSCDFANAFSCRTFYRKLRKQDLFALARSILLESMFVE